MHPVERCVDGNTKTENECVAAGGQVPPTGTPCQDTKCTAFHNAPEGVYDEACGMCLPAPPADCTAPAYPSWDGAPFCKWECIYPQYE